MPNKLTDLPVDSCTFGDRHYAVTVSIKKCHQDGTDDKEEEPRAFRRVVSAPVVSLAVEEALKEAVEEVQSILVEDYSDADLESIDGSVSDPE